MNTFARTGGLRLSVGWLAAWLALALLSCTAPDAIAQTVRGRLLRGQTPAAGVGVNLVYADAAGRRIQTGFVLSAPDGMYYLYNVPPRDYVLQIWDRPEPQRFNIRVQPQQWVDIAPIQVR